MSGVHTLNVGPEDDGQRLDRWLKKNVPGLPYVLALKFIRKGQIRVDGGRAKNDTRLTAGQEIRLPPFEPGQTSMATFVPQDGDDEYIQSLVIYDDGDLVAINKPTGLPTQGGTNIKRHVDGLLPHLAGRDGMTPRLVHRLDRDTSGVLLLARKPETVRAMGKIFQGKNIRKIYWAIVAPAPEMSDGEILARLRKGDGPQKDMMIVDRDEGQFAHTCFQVLDKAGKDTAFVAFWPRTGRTHQIRVHAATIGCPVLGDQKYGNWPEALEEMDLARRLHLHAARITFKRPGRAEMLDIHAPLPEDLQKSWKAFGFEPVYKDDPFADIDL